MTKTVRIGLDFDEPIYPWYDLAHKASVKAGIALPEHEPTSWAPFESYVINGRTCTLDEWVAVLDAEVLQPNGMYHQPFQPGVVEAVRRAYERGYEIHIVTARGQFGENAEKIKKITKSRILHEGMPYNSLTFAKNKSKVYHDLGLHYFLDDAPHNFTPMLEDGCNVYLLDERWNQDIEEPFHPKGRRVRSTQEFLGMVMDREQLARPKGSPRPQIQREAWAR